MEIASNGRGNRPLFRGAVVFAALLWSTGVSGQYARYDNDLELLDRADAARRIGPQTTAVMLDEFVDFACPDCRRFHVQRGEELEAMLAEEGVLFTVRFYVIPQLMRGFHAAEAALCAGALSGQEAFHGMRDALFRRQDVWRGLLDPTPLFESYARDFEVPIPEFQDCLARDAMAPLIMTDLQIANIAGVDGTPTFVVNRAGSYDGSNKLSGGEPITAFAELIRTVRGGQ